MNKSSIYFILPFAIFLTNFQFSFAQTHQETIDIINEYLQCASKNRRSNLEIADSCVGKALVLSKQIGYIKGEIKGHKLKSNILNGYSLLDSALYHINYSALLAESNNDTTGIFEGNLNKALILNKKGDVSESINLLIGLLNFCDSLKLTRAKVGVLLNLATGYSYRGDFQNAMKYYLQADKIITNNLNLGVSPQAIAALYNGLGGNYRNMKNYTLAYQYFSMGISKLDTNNTTIFTLFNNLGYTLIELDSIDKATFYFNKVLKYSKSRLLSKLHSLTGLVELNLRIKKYNKAIYHANKGLELGGNKIPKYLQLQLYEHLGTAFLEIGEYSKAIKHLKFASKGFTDLKSIKKQLSVMEPLLLAELLIDGKNLQAEKFKSYLLGIDSIYSLEKIKSINEVERKYNVEKKEIENISLQREKEIHQITIKNQRAYLFGGGIGLLGILLTSLILYNSNKQKSKFNLELLEKNQQIADLRKEIDHRLRNQMNTVLSFIEKHKNSAKLKETKDILNEYEQRLFTLSALGQLLSPENLEDKVNLKNYLNIILDNLLFNAEPGLGKQIRINYNCEINEIPSENALLIALIVTELFTNSTKHAFRNEKFPEITLKISKTEKSGIIQFIYQDNGNGFDNLIPNNGQGLELINSILNQLKGRIQEFETVSSYFFKATFQIL